MNTISFSYHITGSQRSLTTKKKIMNNTSQYINNIPYDDWPLALGVGLALGVIGLATAGVICYYWYRTPVDLPDTMIVEMNNLESSCFSSILPVLLSLNLAAKVFCLYLLLFTLISFSYKKRL